MSSVDQFLALLDAKKRQLDTASPLPTATRQSLMDDFIIRYAHETTAIEGNTLTLHEAQVLLEDGTTVGGKTLREHLEVINVRSAWQALEAMVRDQAPLTEPALCELHRLLTQGILGDEAGSYRRVPVYIRGSLHVPPNWIKVPDRMQGFVDRFSERSPTEHPIRWAALAHIELAGIHPFVDGNGRVSRLVVNWLLMREGWPPALYTMAERRHYLDALEEAQYHGRSDRFLQVTAMAVQLMVDRTLEMIRQVEEGRGQTRDADEAEWDPE